MRRKATLLIVALVLGILSLRVPAYAETPADSCEVVFQALALLHAFYPEPVNNDAALVNVAISGMAKKLADSGVNGTVLMPSGAGEDYASNFISQRALALKAADGKLSQCDLEFAATETMLASLGDSHTFFISPERYEEMNNQYLGQPSYSGIGIMSFSKYNHTYIFEVFSGSPAERAGLRPWDRILKVDDTLIEGLGDTEAMTAVQQLIRGPAGTTVTLVIKRPGVTSPITIALKRQKIAVPVVASRMLQPGIGYIRLRAFERNSFLEFSRALDELLLSGMQTLVIDLRGNTGGYIAELQDIASIFFPPGVPLQRFVSRYSSEYLRTVGKPRLPNTPVVLLVNGGSASASEILTSAFREYGRGVVAGERTAGAVEAAEIKPLPGGAAMEVTVARAYTGLGNARLEGAGLAPTYEVELTTANLDAGFDSQLAFAVKYLLMRLK